MLSPTQYFLCFALLTGAVCSTLFTESARGADQYRVYVGTYTRGSDSKGIYQLLLDGETGKLTHVDVTGNTVNPSFLAIHPNQKYLYAVNEINDFQGKPAGAVSAFAIDSASGKLTFLNQQSSLGGSPCHLVVDEKGKYVLVANYSGGNICSLPIEKSGSLGLSAAFVQHTGSSVNPARQKAPHAHSINLDLKNRHAVVADLGIDELRVYDFSATDGSLKPNAVPGIKMAPGAGPRHFAFHPSGKWGYVINELNLTVTAMDYNQKNGVFEIIQNISTVPEGTGRKGNSTAQVLVHPSGKFLYGSNRGPNTIAMYRIDQKTGKLTSLGYQPTGGAIPRNFNIDPSGTFLLAANQDSNNVVVFRIDQETGLLKPTGHEIDVPKPVCIQFLPITSTP
ncbi:lactonase family protein [Gimesia panareensis]|uniref:6-phosphogluconolactonase n=1 Tax=Gimesia panareensis TaxID=2527978 RepID=A0A518A897_9PLAN|nr:lactonase family protein [Gimesia panareensis]QDT28090.1 6-phosphogluconolactonase [Gimesia panareensis]QDU50956.1 6-phosphogluconolactonase [Gimesia panareensis]